MSEDHIVARWKDVQGQLRWHWPKLTHEDVPDPDGSAEYLAGVLPRRHGITPRGTGQVYQVYAFEHALRRAAVHFVR